MESSNQPGSPSARDNASQRSSSVAPEAESAGSQAVAVLQQPAPDRVGVSTRHATSTVPISLNTGIHSGYGVSGSFLGTTQASLAGPSRYSGFSGEAMPQLPPPANLSPSKSGALAKYTDRALKKNYELKYLYEQHERAAAKSSLRPQMSLFKAMPWLTGAMFYEGGLYNWYAGVQRNNEYIIPKAVRLWLYL